MFLYASFLLIGLLTTVFSSTLRSPIEDFVKPHYTHYDELVTLFKNLTEQYPDLAKIHSIGQSVENRSLLVLEISKNVEHRDLGEPMVKYVANMHGDESVGRQLLIYLAQYLLHNYNKDPQVTRLVDETDIFLMPSMNPDGFEKSEEGDCNSKKDYTGRNNANNTDLNRDFPDQFDKILNNIERHQSLADKKQKETIAMMEWILEKPFVLSGNFHGGAVVASYPYDSGIAGECCEESKSPDDELFKYLAHTYADNHEEMRAGNTCPFDEFRGGVTNGANWYKVEGGMQDFNYAESNAFDITFELSCCKYPSAKEMLRHWKLNKRPLLKYLEQAHIGIKGIVTDENGNPIENAEIVVDGIDHNVSTTNRGEYWRLLLPGTYDVFATAWRYEPSEIKRVTVQEDGVVKLDFTLQYIPFDVPENGRLVLEVDQYTAGNIIFGAGYSSDMQQITARRCFNATISSISEQKSYIQLGTSISYSELEDSLGLSVSISGGYGMFSADAKAQYLRSLQDKDYALSLNYFFYSTRNVAVQTGYGVKALNEVGRDFYNDGKNPYFGLACGDHYIDSYQEGALLSMGLNINLGSSNAKNEFFEKAGFKYGNIVSAAESLKIVGTKYNFAGSLTIQAFQMGGEPSQLSKILNKDKNGNYYALTCSLTAMDNCIKTASGLLDYAVDYFPTQFSFENNKGLTPLGIAFSNYKPIELLGLTPPVSFISQEVEQWRIELSNKLKENEYYQQKLYPFLNDAYPVKLDGIFINNVNKILSMANNNIRVLTQPNNGAVGCFNMPYKCKNIKDDIDSLLKNITISDLEFLEDMKYTVPVKGGRLYNTGGGNTRSWNITLNKPDTGFRVFFIEIIKDVYSTFDIIIDWKNMYEIYFNQAYVSNGTECLGIYCAGRNDVLFDHCTLNFTLKKELSPFFFELYNNNNNNMPNDIISYPEIVYEVVNLI